MSNEEVVCHNCGKVREWKYDTYCDYVMLLKKQSKGKMETVLVKSYCPYCLPEMYKDEMSVEGL